MHARVNTIITYSNDILTINFMVFFFCFSLGDSGGPMHYEGKTGSIEVIGVVSWGRGNVNLNGCFFPLFYFIKKTFLICLHRLCTTKIARNLYTSRKLFAMDSKTFGQYLYVFAEKRNPNGFLRNII